MRVATLVFAAFLMATPVALAQTEAPSAEAVTETMSGAQQAPAAEEAPVTPPTEQEATPAPSQERVCRAGPRSESRLRSRQQVCRTQAEWDALDRARARSGAN